MYYGNIKKNDIANGKGVRVTLFVSGCTNHCKNCFQPETWDYDYGKRIDSEHFRVLPVLFDCIDGGTDLERGHQQPGSQHCCLYNVHYYAYFLVLLCHQCPSEC